MYVIFTDLYNVKQVTQSGLEGHFSVHDYNNIIAWTVEIYLYPSLDLCYVSQN